MSNVFRRFCAVLIGFVFCVSSILKLIDPVGTGFIVTEYFSFLHLDFLKPAALVTGEALALFESAVGLALVTGVWSRITAWCTSVLVVFFLVISVLLVVFNPPMDCGCFGQAIHLTHSQTLWKNIALFVLAVLSFVPFRYLGDVAMHRYVAFAIAECLLVVLAVYCLLYIPPVDFTEYHASATIVNPDDAGYSSESPALTLWTDENPDCSDEILYGPVMAISVYAPEKIGEKQKIRMAQFAQDAFNSGFTPIVLSAGALDVPGVDTYRSDYKTLKTFNRSNGGLVYLNDGYIVLKRSARNYFSAQKLEELSIEDPIDSYMSAATGKSLAIQAYLLALLVVVFFI